MESVGGIVVSIAAFQAVDPGSIPGRRNFETVHNWKQFLFILQNKFNSKSKFNLKIKHAASNR